MSPSTTNTPSPATTPEGSTSTTEATLEASLSAAALIGQIQKLAWQLARSAPPTAPAPGLQLTPADCHALEDTLGLGSTRDPATLLRAVDRLASLRFGDIRIPFTPGQLAEIQHRAAKRGRTVDAEMKAVVDRIQDELFYKGA